MKANILIIEDNHDLADSLLDILAVDDYSVTAKMSGKEGLAHALDTQPDLIILDIHLPDLNGYQVYERLQADDWGKTAKILILTASESLDEIAKNIRIEKKYVLFKPEISVSELLSNVRQRLADDQ